MKSKWLFAFLAILAFLAGCMSKKDLPLSPTAPPEQQATLDTIFVISNPLGANATLLTVAGITVFRGTTPAVYAPQTEGTYICRVDSMGYLPSYAEARVQAGFPTPPVTVYLQNAPLGPPTPLAMKLTSDQDIHGDTVNPGSVYITDSTNATLVVCNKIGTVAPNSTFAVTIGPNTETVVVTGYGAPTIPIVRQITFYVRGSKPAPGALVLRAPTNGMNGLGISVNLLWDLEPNSATYNLQILDAKTGLASPQVFGITTNTFQFTAGYDKQWSWRVQGVTSSGVTGPWSEQWTFTTAPAITQQPPAAYTLIYPANGAPSMPLAPTLAWNFTPNAISSMIQVSTKADFSAIVFERDSVGGTTLSVASTLQNGAILKNGTVYYWRARGKNQAGFGDWSPVWYFITESAPFPNTEAHILSAPDTVNWGELFEVDVSGVGTSADLSYFGPSVLQGPVSMRLFTVGQNEVLYRVNGFPAMPQATDSRFVYVRPPVTPPPVIDTLTVSVWLKADPNPVVYEGSGGGNQAMGVRSILWSSDLTWGSRNADRVTIEGLPSKNGAETDVSLQGQSSGISDLFARTTVLTARAYRSGVVRAAWTVVVVVVDKNGNIIY